MTDDKRDLRRCESSALERVHRILRLLMDKFDSYVQSRRHKNYEIEKKKIQHYIIKYSKRQLQS